MGAGSPFLFPSPYVWKEKIDQRNCTDNMNVAVINLPTWADHVVSWLVSYRAWRGKNSLRYWGKRSSKCVRHFVLLSSQHANQFSYPITLYALAVHKRRWRSSGEQVKYEMIENAELVLCSLLMIFTLNALLARTITKPNSLVVRTISVSSSNHTYSKYKLMLWLQYC